MKGQPMSDDYLKIAFEYALQVRRAGWSYRLYRIRHRRDTLTICVIRGSAVYIEFTPESVTMRGGFLKSGERIKLDYDDEDFDAKFDHFINTGRRRKEDKS